MESTKPTRPTSPSTVGKPAKLARAIKTAIPLVAMLGGGALASTRNASASVSGRKHKNTAAIYVDKVAKQPHTEEKTQRATRSAFAAFSNPVVNKTRNVSHKVDNNALTFLQKNGLLRQGNTAEASLSGNTLSRKVFSAPGAGFCLHKNVGGITVVPNGAVTGENITQQASILQNNISKGACTGAGHVWHYTSSGCSRITSD